MADRPPEAMTPPPTPTSVYLYNDLPYVAPPIAGGERWRSLIAELLALLHAQPHVRFLEVEPLVRALAGQQTRGPYACTLAIGGAGGRVADLLHARTGWFPTIVEAPLTRVEDAEGAYRVVARGPWDLGSLPGEGAALAIVDDTVYAGQTVGWLLDRLPSADVDLFCLQGVAGSLNALRRRCTVHAGVELFGEPERDLTVIKASHLFEPGAIRSATGDLAFYERPDWMAAWFPDAAGPIVAVCARLHRLIPVPPQ